MNYETLLRNYQRGLWTKEMVHLAVTKGIITEEQYQDILDNKPIDYNGLIETIEELSGVLDDAGEALIEGVESIG